MALQIVDGPSVTTPLRWAGSQDDPGGDGRLVFRRHFLAGFSDPDVTLAINWAVGPPQMGSPTLPATTALPTVVTLAAALGLDVVIDAPMDTRTVDGARRAVRLLADWFGWHHVTIDAPDVVDTAAVYPAAVAHRENPALFWSRGLDSMATLVALADTGHPPKALVAVDWVDPPLGGDGQQHIMDSTAAAAFELGAPLIRVSTNARQFTDPVVSWGQAYGAVLASCGLQLEGLCHDIAISSTFPVGWDQPHGSHPDLDPLWSSTVVTVSHCHAVPGTRIDKAAVVATEPWACEWLKVCWERPGDGNCGTCTKCLLTLTAFHLVDAEEFITDVFDAPLTVDAINALTPTPAALPLVTEILSVLHGPRFADDTSTSLCVAWEGALERGNRSQ